MASSPKLFDQVRQVLRVRHYAYETEKSYIHWIKRFIAFHHMKPPREMGAAEVEAFLTYLAVNLKVAPSTQNQALSALIADRSQNWRSWNRSSAMAHRSPTSSIRYEHTPGNGEISGIAEKWEAFATNFATNTKEACAPASAPSVDHSPTSLTPLGQPRCRRLAVHRESPHGRETPARFRDSPGSPTL
jgi:hypothetical protein